MTLGPYPQSKIIITLDVKLSTPKTSQTHQVYFHSKMERVEQLNNLKEDLIKAAYGQLSFYPVLVRLNKIELTFKELLDTNFPQLLQGIVQHYVKDDTVMEFLNEILDKWRNEIWAPAFSTGVTGTCGVCKASYRGRNPTSSWCGHIFCENCIKESLSKAKESLKFWQCPLCKLTFDPELIHRIHIA